MSLCPKSYRKRLEYHFDSRSLFTTSPYLCSNWKAYTKDVLRLVYAYIHTRLSPFLHAENHKIKSKSVLFWKMGSTYVVHEVNQRARVLTFFGSFFHCKMLGKLLEYIFLRVWSPPTHTVEIILSRYSIL